MTREAEVSGGDSRGYFKSVMEGMWVTRLLFSPPSSSGTKARRSNQSLLKELLVRQWQFDFASEQWWASVGKVASSN